jgi:hypothetical protein
MTALKAPFSGPFAAAASNPSEFTGSVAEAPSTAETALDLHAKRDGLNLVIVQLINQWFGSIKSQLAACTDKKYILVELHFTKVNTLAVRKYEKKEESKEIAFQYNQEGSRKRRKQLFELVGHEELIPISEFDEVKNLPEFLKNALSYVLRFQASLLTRAIGSEQSLFLTGQKWNIPSYEEAALPVPPHLPSASAAGIPKATILKVKAHQAYTYIQQSSETLGNKLQKVECRFECRKAIKPTIYQSKAERVAELDVLPEERFNNTRVFATTIAAKNKEIGINLGDLECLYTVLTQEVKDFFDNAVTFKLLITVDIYLDADSDKPHESRLFTIAN